MNLARLCALCALVACAVISTSKFTWAELDESQFSPVVQTESGAVVGKIEPLSHGRSVFTYLGIPYAEPPIKELRFRPPNPAKPWSGTKEAFAFGKECPQTELPIPGWNITQSGTFIPFIFWLESVYDVNFIKYASRVKEKQDLRINRAPLDGCVVAFSFCTAHLIY